MNEIPVSDRLDWAKGGVLLPAVVQHWRSGEVLSLHRQLPWWSFARKKSRKER
jgi:hypothetical protein